MKRTLPNEVPEGVNMPDSSHPSIVTVFSCEVEIKRNLIRAIQINNGFNWTCQGWKKWYRE